MSMRSRVPGALRANKGMLWLIHSRNSRTNTATCESVWRQKRLRFLDSVLLFAASASTIESSSRRSRTRSSTCDSRPLHCNQRMLLIALPRHRNSATTTASGARRRIVAHTSITTMRMMTRRAYFKICIIRCEIKMLRRALRRLWWLQNKAARKAVKADVSEQPQEEKRAVSRPLLP